MRQLIALSLALVLAGCCCPRPCEPATMVFTTTASVTAPTRQFLVVRCTVLTERGEGGKRQILLESSLISVGHAGAIEALEKAERTEEKAAPVWLAGSEEPNATFGEPSEILTKPSIVTLDGEEATVQVSDADGRRGVLSSSELNALPIWRDGTVEIKVAFAHHRAGALTSRIPEVTLRTPDRRVFIIEVLPAR
jgi:hypothetical protein